MGAYEVRVVITRIQVPDHIEWTVEGTIKPPIGHVYGYELAPHPDGSVVTSYCDSSGAADEWKPIFPVVDEKALRASLGLLQRAVVRGYPNERPWRASRAR